MNLRYIYIYIRVQLKDEENEIVYSPKTLSFLSLTVNTILDSHLP